MFILNSLGFKNTLIGFNEKIAVDKSYEHITSFPSLNARARLEH